MKPAPSGFLLLALSTSVAVGAVPAHAQFYQLDGRFQCLERQGAVCFDATTARPADPPAQATAEQIATAESSAAASPVDHTLDDLKAILMPPRKSPPTASADPLRAIAARIVAKAPAPGDFPTLEAQAKAGNLQAIELLAWCAYAGIGGKPDPVRAYFLYGQAAAAGVSGMAHNQSLVFSTMLTSEQRQQIAEIENSQ